jgi:hypothetical protein
MCRTKFVEIKKHILWSTIPPPPPHQTSCRLGDDVEEYGTARETTDIKIVWRTRIAYWITKATDTHSEYVILIAFPPQQMSREGA